MEKKKRAPGGGRKPLSTSEQTVVRPITLLASQVEQLKQLGNGNISAGVRKALEMATATQPRTITQSWLQSWIDTNRPDLGLMEINGVKGLYKLDAGPAHSFQGIGKTWKQVAAHLEAIVVPDAK